jgi:hypothetical protein
VDVTDIYSASIFSVEMSSSSECSCVNKKSLDQRVHGVWASYNRDR